MKRQNINPHYLLSGLIGLLALIGIASCDDSDIVRKVEPKLEIEEELLVAPSVSRKVVKLHSTYPWFAEASDAWIKLYRYRGQALKPDSIVMELEENPQMEQREGWIEIRLMDQMTKRISIKQNGRGSLITLSKELLYFNVNGGEATLNVVTDLDWLVDQGQTAGLTFEKIDKSHLKVKVAKNTTGKEVTQIGKKYGNQAYHCSEQCRKDVVHPIDKRRKRQDFDEGCSYIDITGIAERSVRM